MSEITDNLTMPKYLFNAYTFKCVLYFAHRQLRNCLAQDKYSHFARQSELFAAHRGLMRRRQFVPILNTRCCHPKINVIQAYSSNIY